MEARMELGERYRDKVSGEEGTALSQTRRFEKCDRAYLRWDSKGRYARPVAGCEDRKFKGNEYDVSQLERVVAPAVKPSSDSSQ